MGVTGLQMAEWQVVRDRAHFLGNNQEIADYAGACEFIRQRQVVLPWVGKSKQLPLPSLRAAYKREVTREPGPVWQWKDHLPTEKHAFYGNLARGCKVLLHPTVLPAFYRASGRTGDPEDYLVDYEEGKLSYVAKQALDLLTGESTPCFIQDLRRSLSQRGVDCARLAGELDDLRGKFYLSHVGVIEEGRRYGYIWDLVDRAWPEMIPLAVSMSRAEARAQVLTALLHSAVLSSSRDLQRMTGWAQVYFDSAMQGLWAEGAVRQVEGTDLLYLTAVERRASGEGLA